MRQAVMTSPGNIEYKDVPEPQPGPEEVLLHIKRIGVCGSDVHVWHGKHPYTSYPVIQGHEFSAVVQSVGDYVKNIGIGTKVTAIPQIVCGECGPCRRGDYHICDNLKVQGFQAPGAAQDLFITTKDKLVLLPNHFTFEQGALVEPVAVAVHSVNRAGDTHENNVVVFGAGPIGNLVAQVARLRGGNVLISDISDFRLEIARECGIIHTVNSRIETFSEGVKRNFGDKGFSVAFEAVGVEETIMDAIASIEKGGLIVVVGVFGEKPRIDVGLIQDRELRLAGTLMYKYEDYLEAVELISSGKLITEPLESKHFSFEKYSEAYEYIDTLRDKCMKVFIDL